MATLPTNDSFLGEDLGRSALVPDDMRAFAARPQELSAINVPLNTSGYVIPYFDMDGMPVPFYRVRLDRFEPKYKQPSASVSHVYFPINFRKLFNDNDYVILTEGEKKAALAVKHGFPCAAFGGVYSWRVRTITLPEGTQLQRDTNSNVKAKLPPGQSAEDNTIESHAAIGFQKLVDSIKEYNKQVIIVYDSEPMNGTAYDVQRAAATLGYELRRLGIDSHKIKQIILPNNTTNKMGLDDYITDKTSGPSHLRDLIRKIKDRDGAFPRHPNPKQFLQKSLKGKLSRQQCIDIAYTIIAELDHRGRRYYSPASGQYFYFDEHTFKLMPVRLMVPNAPIHESIFGQFLYREYGLGQADSRILQWIATQFTAEEPIREVDPQRVICVRDDAVAYQISDNAFAYITADGIEIMSNGSKGILFVQDQVEEIDRTALVAKLKEWSNKPLRPYWLDILKTLNFVNPTDYKLLALLYYISPWMLRWQGTQLPIEVCLGEPGSGKSSLFTLREAILTGHPKLRNMPPDLRDWFAGVTGSGGIYTIDNIHFTDKELRQRLSDEMCRITTAINPTVELRRLYTTNEYTSLPVRVTFGLTAIQQPFFAPDFLQRSMVTELRRLNTTYASTWVEQQLEDYGGRIGWIAHHLLTINRLLRHIRDHWDPKYHSSHRLINYEQLMACVIKVFHLDEGEDPIITVPELGELLRTRQSDNLSEYDWTLQGLQEFVTYWVHHSAGKQVQFSASNISDWASMHDGYAGNPLLPNARKLGRYFKSYQSMIRDVTGIEYAGQNANKAMYKVSGRVIKEIGQTPKN